ncbi:MAG: chaperone modulator CbpM [Gammaproteobacteria bacterium]|nr:chaperone modulator CbpM [Gammaproteobacteria bacterium]
MKQSRLTLSGAVIDETAELTLGELCRACAIHAELIMDMVAEGIVEPRGSEPPDWRFPGTALRRVELTLRLQRDLQINLAGTALVVDLLEELQELRARVQFFERHILK